MKMSCTRMAMASSVLFLAMASGVASATHVTPVQKVIEMLTNMNSQGQKELEVEAATFKEYSEWAKKRTTELGFEIITSERKIEDLKAAIDKFENDVARLAEKIQSLDDDIARMEGEKKAAAAVRAEENEQFVKLQQDYSESVDALSRAISVVKSQNYDRPQAEMLLQRMAKTVRGMRRVLAALSTEDVGAPSVDAYESQTGGIQQMLEGLLQKFKAELADVETEESNRAHYFNLETLHLTDTIAHSTADRADKAATKAATAAASAKAQGELADTVKELAEEKAFLADVTATFRSKSATFAANQQVRKDELAAIGKAVEIISSPEVAASYSDHINLAQLPLRAVSLLQTGSARRRIAARQQAAEFLQKRAGALSSTVLASFAEQVTANPFTKVIEMIEGLLAKLKDEASAEAEHKAWCDEELKNNKLKREKQATIVEKLTAQIEEASSQIASMGSKIETLLAEQVDLTKAVQDATQQRDKEKSQNLATIADAQAGSKAVKSALVVLKEFYASQASLLQARQVPELKEYKGMQGKSAGVLGMLEVIISDFLRLEAETEAAEKQAASAYAKFVSDAEADKLAKHNSEVKLRLQKDQTEFEKSQLEKDLAGNQAELEKANEYFEYLKPACLEVKVSYEERVAKRQEEIEALKEAYGILDQKSSD